MFISKNPKTAAIVKSQIKETVDQTKDGVVFRSGTITCTCGWKRGIMHMYQCLYCNVWFCQICAEVHFGKTVKQYHEEKGNESKPDS